MKKLLLLLALSFFSAQSFAGPCPDGSEPVKSISDDGTYFVFNCGGSAATSSEASSAKSTNVKEGSVKASDINFPGNFYTKEIEFCSAMKGTPTFNDSRSINRVKGLIGYDWHADWEANSISISPKPNNITEPMSKLMSATHNAIANDNQANIKIAKNLLIDLAKADTLYNSIGYNEVRKKPMCYAGGDINAPCWAHQYSFASDVFSNYMITALWLKDELNEQEFKIVNQYINKMYKKFLKPKEFQKEEQGFYGMANGGMSILVYASWANNQKLAAEEINHRFQEMDSLFYEDGYINNNSFRGARAQWYHSFGLNVGLGYVYIAKLWGAEIPEKLHNKLVKASEVTNLAITDWDEFTSRKYSGTQHNKISSKDSARYHTNHMAFALDTLMEIITGVELGIDTVYLQKRKYHMLFGIDEMIGFNPNCTFEALALANSPEELAKKTAAEKTKLDTEEKEKAKLDAVEKAKAEAEKAKAELEADLELPIFDDVEYKLEGQILKVNTFDPKMKPLMRHMGGLMMKCGFGLITGEKKGWLSFVSSNSDNIRNSNNQQCHYDYYKSSNDNEAFELFKAVLSGTDSVLDYLQK